jgi:predicted ribosomally synthesized peptide with nif11-like leader
MKNDEDFRKKVTECKDAEARKSLAVKEGFNFSVNDLKECSGELSDEELSRLAGGLELWNLWSICRDDHHITT